MNVSIKIDKKGHLPGSLGWLCENAATIHVGTTKGGSPVAWLKDHAGKTITVLAISDFFDMHNNSVETVSREEINGFLLAADRDFTDAAWSVIEQLAKAAKGLLQEPAELAESVSVRVG